MIIHQGPLNHKDKAVSQPSSLILIVLNWIPFHKKIPIRLNQN